MTFLKLTANDDGEPIYINADKIRAVYFSDEYGCTVVDLGCDTCYGVKESPEQIELMSRLKQISL